MNALLLEDIKPKSQKHGILCYKKKETLSMDIKGREIVSALPKTVSLRKTVTFKLVFNAANI